MRVLGFSISAADNDSYMNNEVYSANICDCIDFVKNRPLHLNDNFILVNEKYDISYTYDSYLIVSNRFKQFCLDNQYEGISFYNLPNYSSKYLMIVDKVINFDSARRETEFLEFNIKCNEFNEVVGATPICLLNNIILSDGFFKTDIEFGRGYSKNSILLVGNVTAEQLKSQKFKGLYLEKIFDKYDWESK